jgi:hypothetical protein
VCHRNFLERGAGGGGDEKEQAKWELSHKGFIYSRLLPYTGTHQFQSNNLNEVLQNHLFGTNNFQKGHHIVQFVRITNNLKKE